MKIIRNLVAGIAIASAVACPLNSRADINNPITKAVLKVYEDQIRENPQDYVAYFSRANEYFQHDELVRALDDLNNALKYIPEKETGLRYECLIRRADIYNQTNRPTQALEDLSECVRLSPESFIAIFKKADTEYALGKYAEAKVDYNRLIRLNGRNPEIFIGLAKVAVKENNLGTANELLDQAVSLDPNNAETYVSRASVRKLMGDHNGAVDDLLLAVSTDTKKTNAYEEIVEYGKVNYPATMAGLSKAIADAPQTGMFRYLRAMIAQAHYNYLAAISDYDYIIEHRLYDYHGIYASLAECQLALGRFDAALSNIDYALGMVRDNCGYYVLRSKILRALGRNDQAVQAASNALVFDRNSSAALEEMAMCEVERKDYEKALEFLGEASLNDSESPESYMLRAWISEKFLNRPDAARQLYTQVSEMDHFYIDNVRSLKGFALLFLGDKEGAERWMNNILASVDDYDGMINYYGACFFAQYGDNDRAIRCVENALEKGYANYFNWTDLKDGRINVAPLRDDLRFLNLLSRYSAIFGRD